MQRVPNYGSFLQAYGLKQMVEKLGHEVVFIDYKEGAPIVSYDRSARLKYKILNIPFLKKANDWTKYYVLGKEKFDYKYRLTFLKKLGIGYKKNSKAVVDIAIVGSDEVFNCLQEGFNVGFSPMLFGQKINAKKVISYAASFGYTELEKLRSYGIQNIIAGYLKSLSSISVRDENSRLIVEQLIGKIPEVHLDPVLVADYNVPEIDIPYRDFVILYTYKSRHYTEEDKENIQCFCKNNGKKLISIGAVQDWIEHCVEADPFELLAYFKAADFVITDTFHGSVLSIKYNKPFAVMIRDNNKHKLDDLIQRLDKKERILKSFINLQEVYDEPIDYSKTNAIIEREIAHSIDYLRSNIA